MNGPHATARAFEQGKSPIEPENANSPALPELPPGQPLDIDRIRDERENFYLKFIWLANAGAALLLLTLAFTSPAVFLAIVGYGALIAAVSWMSWKLTYAAIYGHGIEVGPNQFPQIYNIVKEAADRLEVPVPTVLILQGHGIFELFVAKRFTRRGLIVITSNMLDEFVQRPDSREFMMFIGRQLGHLKAGHFRLWFFKDVIGLLAFFFHAAYWRRCHLTADRIGLLVAGKLGPAEQALCIITVGARSAPGTNIDEVVEQRTRLFEGFWSWIQLGISQYPYMVDRVVRLRRYAMQIGMQPVSNVGTIPVHHSSLRPLPILIIHGHDKLALLELKDFLHSKLPNVVPRLMLAETVGSLSLPEKFEQVASDVRGAIALLTPDDIARMRAAADAPQQFRARQNVVVEIGWIWGRLGRQRCLVLVRDSIEIPSDLTGIDCHPFGESPNECSEAIRSFVAAVERETRMAAAA